MYCVYNSETVYFTCIDRSFHWHCKRRHSFPKAITWHNHDSMLKYLPSQWNCWNWTKKTVPPSGKTYFTPLTTDQKQPCLESLHAQGQGRVKWEWCPNNCCVCKLTGAEKPPTPQLHLLQAPQDLRRSDPAVAVPNYYFEWRES